MSAPAIVSEAIRACAEHFGTTVRDVRSRSKFAIHARPRMIAYWIVFKRTKASLSAIGAWFDRDHSTIQKSLRRLEDRRREPRTARDIVAICEALGVAVPGEDRTPRVVVLSKSDAAHLFLSRQPHASNHVGAH